MLPQNCSSRLTLDQLKMTVPLIRFRTPGPSVSYGHYDQSYSYPSFIFSQRELWKSAKSSRISSIYLSVTVTLGGGGIFKGFLIHAKDQDGNMAGTFAVSDTTSCGTKTLICNGGVNALLYGCLLNLSSQTSEATYFMFTIKGQITWELWMLLYGHLQLRLSLSRIAIYHSYLYSQNESRTN